MLKTIFVFLSLFALGGCAPPYKPPTDGKIAYIRHITTEVSESVGVFNDENGDCRNISFVGSLNDIYSADETESRVGMDIADTELLDPDLFHEQVISAERLTTVYYKFPGYSYSCDLTVAFQAEENGEYESIVEWIGRSCSAQVFRVVKVGDEFKRVLEPSVRMNPRQCNW